jgi:putative oxidoreductase
MEVGLLVIHVVIGVVLVLHGTQKLFGIRGSGGLDATTGYVASFGLRPARPAALAAGTMELVGGLLLAAGFATPLAAALIAATMIVAARTDHRGKGLWIFNGGVEYVLVVGAVVIGLAFNGAGTWSVDNAIGWDLSGVAWGLGALGVAVAGAVTTLVLLRERHSMAAVPAAS